MPRPLLRTAAAAAALLLALTGCGSGSEPPQEGGAAPAGAFPVTLNHAFGATTIPAEPKRVVAVGLNDSDFLLSLGVVPVASREFTGGFDWENRAWAQQSLGGRKPVALTGTSVPVEQIAALQPDLIIGVYSFLDKTTYDALSKIAPTVAASTPDGTNAAPWPEQLRSTGQAVGRTPRADEVIAETRKKFDDTVAAHPAFAGKSLKMDFVVGGMPIDLGTDDLRAQLFDGLGFQVAPDTRNLSPEQQGRLDADVLVVMGRTKAEAMADPVFANIPAVKAGRVAFLGAYTTDFAGALGFSSPLSLPYAIDSVTPKLDAALKGRPQGS